LILKAVVIRDKNPDVYRLLRIGCAEAKKALGTREHVKPIDFIKREYGYIVVVELSDASYGKTSVVRDGVKMSCAKETVSDS